MKPRRTTPGRYIIYSYGPYVTRTWAWSRIVWGARLSLDATGQHVFYASGNLSKPWVKVENDFGAMAARYFKDTNGDGKLDNGETLSGEMFHTTPDNEAEVAKGQSVTFEHSHGCIHLNPIDRDRLHASGAFERGVRLNIHPYSEIAVPVNLR